MGFLADIGLPGLENALLGQGTTDYQNPIGPQQPGAQGDQYSYQPKSGLGLLGSPGNWAQQQPIALTPQQYQDASQSLPGVLNSFRNGYLSGFSNLAGGDQRAQAADYNAQLGQAQQIGIQGLGIPKAQLISGLLSGTIDPSAPGAPQTPGAPQAAGQAPQGMPQAQGGMAPGSAPMAQGGAPGTSPGGSPSGGAGLLNTPPAGAGAAVPRLFGIPTPGGIAPQSAFIASQLAPDLLKEFAAGVNAPKRAQSYGLGPNGQMQYFPGGIPGVAVPPGDPNFLSQAAQFTSQQKGIEQRAIGSREVGVHGRNAATDYQLEFGGGPAGNSGPPAPASGAPVPSLGAIAGTGSSAPQSAPQALPPVTLNPVPQGAVPAPPPGQVPMVGINQQMVTPSGSIIPAKAEMTPIDMSGNSLKANQPGWTAARDTLYKQSTDLNETEERVQAIAQAFQATQSGSWATDKADIAGKLKALGIDIGPNLGDITAVQTALKNNWTAAMGMMKGISQRGPTEREIVNTSKNFMHPDLQPQANHNIAAQTLGIVRWQKQAITDYRLYGSKMGWKDPNDFVTAWQNANPVQGFVAKADKDIPPFQGMPGAIPPNTPAFPPVTKTLGGATYKWVP